MFNAAAKLRAAAWRELKATVLLRAGTEATNRVHVTSSAGALLRQSLPEVAIRNRSATRIPPLCRVPDYAESPNWASTCQSFA
jgi:hypothetical protein